ncbi:MAG: hypothetical protein Q7U97_14525 [Rhodocyclaceae bacterium]|nr:hypothetical protein [Rhodocyclaceae bacterium]
MSKPIDIKHESPPYNLGGAHFLATSPAGSNRLFGASAEKSARCLRPINLSAATDEHRSDFSLSLEEAEALIACLTHAVALRSAADAETRKAA